MNTPKSKKISVQGTGGSVPRAQYGNSRGEACGKESRCRGEENPTQER